MNESVFKEIKSVMSVLSMLQLRQKTFREELNFFNLNLNNVSQQSANPLYIGALKRLEHEVGFLCIDTYSLYQGIEKKKSLYSKAIKQNGKLLSKVDKTPSDRDSFEFLGIADFDGEIRPFLTSEENDHIKQFEEEAYFSREELRQNSGITSNKHEDLDKWAKQNLNLDAETLSELAQYRKEFAHRLDSLDNLQREFSVKHPVHIKKMLDAVLKALTQYAECLQNILGYTKSQHYLGISGLKYDSLSRLKLAESLISKKEI